MSFDVFCYFSIFIQIVFPHNLLFCFPHSGWEDAPLADEGIEEAKIAGQNLKKHGFE